MTLITLTGAGGEHHLLSISAAEGASGRRTPDTVLRVLPAIHPIRALRRTLRRVLGPRMVRLEDRVDREEADAFITAAVRASSPVYQGVDIERRVVDLDRVYPLSRFYSPGRFRAAKTYIKLAQRRSIELFEPTCLRHWGERDYHLALPPIVEPWSDGYAVIDGVHRLYALRERGAREATVVAVVSRALPPLPGTPGTWQSLRSERTTVQRRKKFRQFKRELFRPAASYFRSERFRFYSLPQIDRSCRRAAANLGPASDVFWCHKHRDLDRCNSRIAKGSTLTRDERPAVGR